MSLTDSQDDYDGECNADDADENDGNQANAKTL